MQRYFCPTQTKGFLQKIGDENQRCPVLANAEKSAECCVSWYSANHQNMVQLRIRKIKGIANDIPPLTVNGPAKGDLLVLGWGSTYGAIRHAVENVQKQGFSVAAANLRYLNPFPANTGDVLRNFQRVLIPELNAGQLRLLIRAEFLVDAVGLSKITGQPFMTDEIEKEILAVLGSAAGGTTGAIGQAVTRNEGVGA